MARARNRKSKQDSNTQTQTTHERTTNIMALTPEQIRGIYAKRRTKGQYTQFLSQFLESGENGTDVKETWPQLADKKGNTIKQGFENAKEKKEAPEGADLVDVIVDGEDVYLINAAALSPELLAAAGVTDES